VAAGRRRPGSDLRQSSRWHRQEADLVGAPELRRQLAMLQWRAIFRLTRGSTVA